METLTLREISRTHRTGKGAITPSQLTVIESKVEKLECDPYSLLQSQDPSALHCF